MADAIRTIDLFSGAGGLTAGFHQASARFTPVVAVEHDRDAAASYQANHADTKVVNEPIQEWVARGKIPEADVIIGGPPCQGFSALGKRDINDERNFLWEQYAEVIVAARPRYFVVENVAQFLISPQFAEFEGRTARGESLADYDLRARAVLNAAEYGAHQVRRRTVVIGRRRDVPAVAMPGMTQSDPAGWATVQQAWSGLEPRVTDIDLPDRWTTFNAAPVRGEFKTSELHLTRTYQGITAARIGFIPYGGNRFDIPLALQPTCWRQHRHGSGDVMGRLSWDRPSVTIRTEFVKPEKGRYLHPVENRAITLQEGARLQGFPDDYRWCGTKTSIAKQIGNAVPIELGVAVAGAILRVMDQ